MTHKYVENSAMVSEPIKNSEVHKTTRCNLVIFPDETAVSQRLGSKFLINVLKMVGSQFNIIETAKQ